MQDLKLIGVYDDRSADRREVTNHPRWSVVGRSHELVKACHEGKLDAVYVALPLEAEQRTAKVRAHAVAHNEKYRAIIHGYMLRHMVKPGITGWAQVNGWRGETAELVKMEERVRHDMDYIRNWNLFLDLKIIFLTIFGAKKSQNAC